MKNGLWALVAFDDVFMDSLIARMDQNQEIFSKILDDRDFGAQVKNLIARRVYNRFNNINNI